MAHFIWFHSFAGLILKHHDYQMINLQQKAQEPKMEPQAPNL